MLTKVFTPGVLPGESEVPELWEIASGSELREVLADCVK